MTGQSWEKTASSPNDDARHLCRASCGSIIHPLRDARIDMDQPAVGGDLRGTAIKIANIARQFDIAQTSNSNSGRSIPLAHVWLGDYHGRNNHRAPGPRALAVHHRIHGLFRGLDDLRHHRHPDQAGPRPQRDPVRPAGRHADPDRVADPARARHLDRPVWRPASSTRW